MEKENKKNGGYIFVIIILLIIVGVLGYLYVNKDLGDKTNCDIKEKGTKEEKSSEIKEKNNETKDYAIKYDLPNDLSECFKDEKDILDRNIKVLTISANGLIITRLFEDENAKLTKEEKLKLIYNYLTDYFHMATTGVNDLDTDSNKQELSGDIIRGMYYLVFGEKIDSLMDLSGCPQYRYDSKNDVVYRIVNCGGTGYRTLTYRNVAYGRKDDELYVYQKALFTGDGMHYDIDGKESVQYIENATEDEYFYKYQDKIKTYKYTFKEVFGGIYQFISLEEVK